MAAKRASKTAKSTRVFGQLQIRTMREYAGKRGWEIAVQIKEVGSGAVERELREKLMAAARRREIDVVLVWRLDRWGRSLADLVVTLKELSELGVGFVSLTNARPPARAAWGERNNNLHPLQLFSAIVQIACFSENGHDKTPAVLSIEDTFFS